MQVHGPPDLVVSQNQLPVTDFNRIIKAKKEQLGPDSGCLCGQSFVLGNVVKVCPSGLASSGSLAVRIPHRENDHVFHTCLIVCVFASSSATIAKSSSIWTVC